MKCGLKDPGTDRDFVGSLGHRLSDQKTYPPGLTDLTTTKWSLSALGGRCLSPTSVADIAVSARASAFSVHWIVPSCETSRVVWYMLASSEPPATTVGWGWQVSPCQDERPGHWTHRHHSRTRTMSVADHQGCLGCLAAADAHSSGSERMGKFSARYRSSYVAASATAVSGVPDAVKGTIQ